MPPPRPRTPLAGGFLIALGVFAGVAIGFATGQQTIGFLAGLGAGAALALAVWALDRRRS